MALRSKDYRKVLEIIEIPYLLQNREAMFQTFCTELESLVGFSSSCFLRFDPESQGFQFDGCLLFNQSPEVPRLFLSYYQYVHPNPVVGAPMNRCVYMNDSISDSRLVETEYSRDFQSQFSFFYEIGTMLKCQGDLIGGIGFHRSRQDRAFGNREKAIFNIVFPHLARAFHMEDLIAEREELPTGKIEMDKNGQVLHMNENAARALNGRLVSSITDPGMAPTAASLHEGERVNRMRSIPGSCPSETTTLNLEPLPDRSILQSSLGRYTLTRRQQEVAVLVIRGLSNRQIAERLFVTEQTVRDHLQAVFEKVQVHSRSMLSAKVLELAE